MTPTEFKLFGWGVNDSSSGAVMLDRRGVASIFRRRGCRDVMIDLEHLALEKKGPSDFFDARGWGKLEVRDDGLYLVNVTWTPDGERRLKEKTQRYVSPAFYVDEKNRVVELVNVALTALPASLHLPALVAASARSARKVNNMDPKLLEALGLPPEASVADVLAALADATEAVASMAADVAPEAADAAEEAGSQLEDAADVAIEEEEEAMEEMAEEADEEEEMLSEEEEEGELKALEELAAKLGYSLSKKNVASALAHEVSRLSQRLDARDRNAILRSNRPRMTAAQYNWAAGQPLDVLKSFCATLPKRPRAHRRPAAAPVVLNSSDVDVAKATGLSLEAIKQFRKGESR